MHNFTTYAPTPPSPVIQSELMWLDKDDLETIAIGYTTAVEVITEKVIRQTNPDHCRLIPW